MISDHLTLNKGSYKPFLNSNLRFDGYYTNKRGPLEIAISRDAKELWTDPITPRFFFEDGSIAYSSIYKNEQHLTESLLKYEDGLAYWSIFEISNDTLTTQMLMPNSGMIRERITHMFLIIKNSLVLIKWIDRKGKSTLSADTLYFHSFQNKPKRK